MKLEAGKRYVLRNGNLTGALEVRGHRGDRFRGSDITDMAARTWNAAGQWYYYDDRTDDDISGYDIVSEYVEPRTVFELKDEPVQDYEQWYIWADDRYPIAFVIYKDGSTQNVNVNFEYKQSDHFDEYHWKTDIEAGNLKPVSKDEAFAYLKSKSTTASVDKPVEAVEPQQPLRWVEHCKPDKPGIWAWRYDTSRTTRPTLVVELSEDDCQNCSTNGIEWCYIGPIPEILPPKKKVTERLWIQFTGGLHKDFDLIKQVWLDDSATVNRTDFVRTDRTREVEQ